MKSHTYFIDICIVFSFCVVPIFEIKASRLAKAGTTVSNKKNNAHADKACCEKTSGDAVQRITISSKKMDEYIEKMRRKKILDNAIEKWEKYCISYEAHRKKNSKISEYKDDPMFVSDEKK